MADDLFPREDTAPDGARRVYRVAELTRAIKTMLEDAYPAAWVEGEVSNLRRPASGHLYFTLKDEQAQLQAVFFRGAQRTLTFDLRDGLQVRLFGGLSVYERQGQYQLIVRRAEEAGRGALREAFERLKKRLVAEGLFDPARKRPLPLLPRHVGVVTSPTGAAIRDILNVVGRRFPNLHIVLAPARVQGEGAAAEIAAAIDLLNARGGLDVLIVGRGGGSLEDLWAFNEEPVARAIARSAVPVISAVGHEIDFTISDFVADVRAPTPSAAAELVVGRKASFEEQLDQRRQALRRLLRSGLLAWRRRYERCAGHYVFREPRHAAAAYRERLGGLRGRLARAARDRVRQAQQRVDADALLARHAADRARRDARQSLRRLSAQVHALGPLAVLARGFSITCTADGAPLRAAAALRTGDRLRTRLHEGRIESTVDRAFADGKEQETT